MKKTIIALSSTPIEDKYIKVSEAYLEAVYESGGIPMLVSPRMDDGYIERVCRTVDGFLFCGGGDLDPKYYGEERNNLTRNICSKRDGFEHKLFVAAYKTGKPMFGICRGLQVFNVFLGGSLRQHVDGHQQDAGRAETTHSIEIFENSLLYYILGESKIDVNSFHHQTVKDLAYGLVCDAISAKDGYIEAFHHSKHPFLLGVQWHPECYFDLSETSSKIFKEFIKACEK